MSLKSLLRDVRACALWKLGCHLAPDQFCNWRVPQSLLIISQAPGKKVHETGIPWNDASGDRLRDWLRSGSTDFLR